ALLAQVASYLGSGYLLSALVAVGDGRLSIRAGTLITIASSTVGVLVGGQFGTSAAAYRWLHRTEFGTEGASLATWAPSLLNNSILVVVTLLGTAALFVMGGGRKSTRLNSSHSQSSYAVF